MTPTFEIHDESRIYIGSASELLPEILPQKRIVVISDTTIAHLHAPLLASYETILIGTSEKIKTLQTIETIYRRFIELGVDRSTFVLAIGGGIVTDIAGFAASTYMRGLQFGFVSTTLLGQVDASVGGKNGVNIDGYKNMAGCFNQPAFVICDPSLLSTLPEREFRAGLAEVIKTAIIADADLFAQLESTTFDQLRQNTDQLSDIIAASIRIKADIVTHDERETGERRKLNLGHTLAHAIEKSSDQMIHGEAVAVGTVLISEVAVKLGTLSVTDYGRIVSLHKQMGFVTESPVSISRLLQEVGKDKKNKEGMLRIVLPAGIGDCEIMPISPEEFARLLQ